MGNDENGPHHPHIVSAEILPVEFGNKAVMAPLVDGIHDEYTQSELGFSNFVQYWDESNARDIWVCVNTDQTSALRLVIEPVSKDSAHHIRRQYDKVCDVEPDLPKFDDYYMQRGIHLDDGLAAKLRQVVQGIADRIADAWSEQQYRNEFLYALVRLPDQFVYLDGRIAQLDGIRCYVAGLKPVDVALLKRV